MRLKMTQQRIAGSFRSHTLTLALLAAGLVPNTASALGLGAISNQSHLGEPLKARIELVNLPENLLGQNILVRQVSSQDADAMGVEIVSGWLPLEFSVDTRGSRNGIQVISRRPIKEPYINFLVELKWPKGTLYREYTLFLDPAELTAPQQQTVEKLAKTTNSASDKNSRPIKTTTYRIRVGDTLNDIARRVAPSTGMEIRQIVDWVYTNNPSAFGSSGKNHLLAGARLQLPGAALPPATAVSEPETPAQPQGRLLLSSPVASPQADTMVERLQTTIAANHRALEQLSKENRDLTERLRFIEDSGYIAKLERLVVAQQHELALMRDELLHLQAAQQTDQQQETRLTPLAAKLDQAPAYLWGLLLAGLTVMLSFIYAIGRLRFKHLFPFETSGSNQPGGMISATGNVEDTLESALSQSELLPRIKQDRIKQDRRVRQAVAEEARKVQLIRQQIQVKTGNYEEQAHPASNDTHLVEEIEIDPELEAYLKIK